MIAIIEGAKKNAYRKVNEELINMYWCVGQFISEESKTASYGDSFIDELSQYIQDTFPGIKGFNRRGLYRMKQFYETYVNYEKVSPLVTQQTVDKAPLLHGFPLLPAHNLHASSGLFPQLPSASPSHQWLQPALLSLCFPVLWGLP